MITYIEVAQELVDAGYLSDADVDAAVDILTDALVVAEAEEAEAVAMAEYADQDDLIAEAKERVSEDAAVGDYESAEIDEGIIAEAVEARVDDEDTVIAAEEAIEAAYNDAAAALLAAELIDEANAEAVASMLADLWVDDEDA